MKKGLLAIHLAVLLYGTSGLFAKLLALDPVIIVLGKFLFSTIFLILWLLLARESIRLKHKKDYPFMLSLGVLLAIHSVTFFKSIQVSSVSVGLLAFATFPIFVAFLEPLFFREKIRLEQILIALVAFVGVLVIIPNDGASDSVQQGILWGLLSGLTYGLLLILCRKGVQSYSSLVVSLYGSVVTLLVLTPYFFILQPEISGNNWMLLVLLGVVFTALANWLYVKGLKDVTAYLAGLITNLQPIYGTVAAIFLLSEIPSVRTLIGGLIILCALFFASRRSG